MRLSYCSVSIPSTSVIRKGSCWLLLLGLEPLDDGLITDFWNGADLQWRRNERLCLLTSWATLSCFLFRYNTTVLNLMSSNFHHLMLDCLIWLSFIGNLPIRKQMTYLRFFLFAQGIRMKDLLFPRWDHNSIW